MALNRRRQVLEEDIELDMVPIMNMFLVLIPFLLLSASFFHIKAINTSVPVLSSANQASAEEKKPPVSDIKVTVIVELKDNKIQLTAMSDELEYKDLVKLEADIPMDEEGYPMDQLAAHLKYIKGTYPKSDTLILVPTGNVVYGTIIKTMDMARSADSTELFPNVVLSGKVG